MNILKNTFARVRCTIIALAIALSYNTAFAQFGGIGREALKRTSVTKVLEGEPPITTSLQDARFADATRDGFTPEPLSPLSTLQRTANGGFVLNAGGYWMQSQSYCLKAGTHGPGGGDGYLYAPPLGPAEEAVVAIVHNSVQHNEIEQSSIQQLLWAIIARAKFEELNAHLKITASVLLTTEQLAALNRSAIDILPGPVVDRAVASLPSPVQAVLQAEAELRRMLMSSTASFEEMERVAVLSGMAPVGEGSIAVPSGRWSLHPDGYYVRYVPSGYSSTRIEIWVPGGSPAIGRTFDPALHIAVPGNTARQRLIQSARSHK